MSLAAFSTCTLSDALLKLGVASAGHFPDIVRFSGSSRICGPAYTVKMVYATDKDSPKLDQHFVDTTPPNSVIVIDAPTHAKNAVWGGLMTAGALARNALGVVISGRCRDLAEHRSLNFPVFARGHSTVGQSPFTRPSAVNVPLEINPFDPYDAYSVASPPFPFVQVNPGDWIIGDEDGVVCVPKELEAEVLELCAQLVEIDDKCLEDIKAGKGVQASFKLHRGK